MDLIKRTLDTALWSAKATFEYTSRGFLRNSKKFTELIDFDHSSSPLVVYLTGANSGIGFAIAKALLRLPNIHLTIVCRDPRKGQQAMDDLQEEMLFSSTLLELRILDLADPHQIIEFGESLVASKTKINVLINNAGYMADRLEFYKNTLYEMSFVTNVIGTKLLTESLIPCMRPHVDLNDEARVITVTSGGALTEKLNYIDPSNHYSYARTNNTTTTTMKFDGVKAYAQQKRQQIHLQEVFQRKYPDIRFVSMHPGWVDTPGVAHSLPNFYKVMKKLLRTPEQGADTAAFLAVDNRTIITHDIRAAHLYFDRDVVNKYITDLFDKNEEAAHTRSALDIFENNLLTVCKELLLLPENN